MSVLGRDLIGIIKGLIFPFWRCMGKCMGNRYYNTTAGSRMPDKEYRAGVLGSCTIQYSTVVLGSCTAVLHGSCCITSITVHVPAVMVRN